MDREQMPRGYFLIRLTHENRLRAQSLTAVERRFSAAFRVSQLLSFRPKPNDSYLNLSAEWSACPERPNPVREGAEWEPALRTGPIRRNSLKKHQPRRVMVDCAAMKALYSSLGLSAYISTYPHCPQIHACTGERTAFLNTVAVGSASTRA